MEAITAELEETKAIKLREKLAAYVELTKPRIAFLLVLTSAAGFYLGADKNFNYTLFANAMVGISLLAFGVAALNQFIERDIDKLMERTAARPLPTKKITPAEALIFGVSLTVVAEIYLAFLVNGLTAILGLLVVVGYVFLYTPLKTRTSFSTAIGAFPGALPPLMGFTAASNEITLGAWILFAMLFLWQFPHFLAIAWMYRKQYAKAGILMLPVVEPAGKITARQIVIFTVLLLPVSFAPFFIRSPATNQPMAGWLYLIGAVALGIWFLLASVRAARTKTDENAKRLLIVSVLYLPIVFTLLVLDH